MRNAWRHLSFLVVERGDKWSARGSNLEIDSTTRSWSLRSYHRVISIISLFVEPRSGIVEVLIHLYHKTDTRILNGAPHSLQGPITRDEGSGHVKKLLTRVLTNRGLERLNLRE